MPDPNALATEILTGGWCELDIVIESPQTRLPDSPVIIERKLLPIPTPAQREKEEEMPEKDGGVDEIQRIATKHHIPHHHHPDGHTHEHVHTDRHYRQYGMHEDRQSEDASVMSAMDAFYETFPDAEHG